MITHFVARTALILSCKPLADKRVIKGKMIRSSQVGKHILLGIESSNSHHVAIKYLYLFLYDCVIVLILELRCLKSQTRRRAGFGSQSVSIL